MPASPTDATNSTSSAARDRAATEAAATAPEATSPPADGARDVTPSVSPTAGPGPRSKAAAPACPHCGAALVRYAGEAAHKLSTAFCTACGVRHRLPASAAADDAAAPGSTSGTSGTKAVG